MSRKDEILDAVITKFQGQGFSTNLTISEIANKVDIGKSTIYEYFKTKDDLFKEALLKIATQSIHDVLNIKEIETLGFKDAFKAQYSKMLEVAQKSRVIYQLFSQDFMHRMPMTIKGELKCKMEETRDVIEERFTMIFVKGVEERLIHIDPDPANILIFSSLIVGSLLRYSSSNEGVPLEVMVDKIYNTIIKLGN